MEKREARASAPLGLRREFYAFYFRIIEIYFQTRKIGTRWIIFCRYSLRSIYLRVIFCINLFLFVFFLLLTFSVVAVCRTVASESNNKPRKRHLSYFGWLNFQTALAPISHANDFRRWTKLFGWEPGCVRCVVVCDFLFEHNFRHQVYKTQKIFIFGQRKKQHWNSTLTVFRFNFSRFRSSISFASAKR